ncbi:OLC1v1005019C1 [Oldenlandia corymbosa var. corymbosa]|uniref:OLC1v1005019C1 n=1 Tax=Oldenlandia corymbosa var. corymbosa TaxID=529605 RepID=A0AAV1DGD2_OLDCO|nr:OLC1v1005019C1 [Oldenlandia corymbosa var. corymbosa]
MELEKKPEGSHRRTDIIQSCKIGSVPPTVFYVSDFISAEEEQQLLNNVYKAPVAKWKVLKNRRLQNWGGVVHEKGLLAQDLPPWLTRITRRIFDESGGMFPSPINHVLINEYLADQGIMPHQDGPAYSPVVAILSLGSPVVMDFTPHLSLQVAEAGTVQNRDTENEHQPFSVLLMPRSLLIFKDEVYSDYLHGIKDDEHQQVDQVINRDEITKIPEQIQSVAPVSGVEIGGKRTEGGKVIHRTTTRVSMTCRTVTKVHKSWLKV